jgi:hypothetical protein
LAQHRKPQALDCLERDFLAFRSTILELAAFLDRIDRYEGGEAARGDFRYRALMTVLDHIIAGRGDRVDQILKLLSDPTPEPVVDITPPARAVGAWRSGSGAD